MPFNTISFVSAFRLYTSWQHSPEFSWSHCCHLATPTFIPGGCSYRDVLSKPEVIPNIRFSGGRRRWIHYYLNRTSGPIESKWESFAVDRPRVTSVVACSSFAELLLSPSILFDRWGCQPTGTTSKWKADIRTCRSSRDLCSLCRLVFLFSLIIFWPYFRLTFRLC